MRRRTRISSRLFTVLLTGLALLPGVTRAQDKPSAAEVLELAKFSEKHLRDLLAGEKVTVQAHEASRREIAVALACLIPPEREGSLAPFRNAVPIMPDKYRDSSGSIDPDDLEASLVALSIGKDARDEAKRYLRAKPGWGFSLSSEEIAAFAALDPPKGQEVPAVEGQLRRMFAARVRDYRSKGLAGIAPFDRGEGEVSSAGEDLQRSTIVSKGFEEILPDVHRALLEYPLGFPSQAEEYYFWTRIQVLGRPVFLLNQRLAGQREGRSVVVERQFYATQFLGAGQTVIALIQVQEGTLAFYVNHTFVDRWTGPGFTTGAKRAAGLKIIDGIVGDMAEKYGLCEGIP
jgi:hypothetical protein